MGLKFKKNSSGTIDVTNSSGKKLMKVNKTKNSTLADNFDPKDYSPATHDFIDNTLTPENSGNLPRIKGVDGKFMTAPQVEAAVTELKAGNITNGAKAIYDAVEKIVKDDNADFSDDRMAHVQDRQIPFSEFKEHFKEPVKEATPQEIGDLAEAMGPEAFEKYLNELIKNETDYYKHSEESAASDQPATSGQPAEGEGGAKKSEEPVDEKGTGKGDAGAAKQGYSDTDLSSATKRVDDAQKAYDKALRDLSKAEDKFAGKQAKQGDLLNEQKNVQQNDMFANNADVIKDTLDPLKAKVKEAKAELDKAQKELKNAQEREQPDLFDADHNAKVKYARRNSFPEFTKKYPDVSNEDYNKLRAEKPVESSKQKKVYEEVSGSKPNNKTGRIPVDPIVNKTPKQISDIIADFTKSMGQKLNYMKSKRRRSLGSYSPSNAGIKIRYTGDMDVVAHEIGHSIDDQFKILDEFENNTNHPAEKELKVFSKHGSTPPKGHPDPRMYKLGEGMAEWLRAFIVNPSGRSSTLSIKSSLL